MKFELFGYDIRITKIPSDVAHRIEFLAKAEAIARRLDWGALQGTIGLKVLRIKAYRTITHVGLADAKEWVEMHYADRGFGEFTGAPDDR